MASIETDRGRRLAEGLVKSLTGGDKIAARDLYQSDMEFRPEAKLWLVANDAPCVSDDDDAIWRRIDAIPFERQVDAAKRDPTVKATLRIPAVAGPAILTWMVEGCRRWQKEGLGKPEAVRRATDRYRRSMDPVQAFVAEECLLDPAARTSGDQLWRAFQEATPATVRQGFSKTKFGRRLSDAGCRSKPGRVGGSVVRGWQGIRLREPDDDLRLPDDVTDVDDATDVTDRGLVG